MLPPAAEDAGHQDSDIEKILDNPEGEYEPVEELEVEEDIESESDNEIPPLQKKNQRALLLGKRVLHLANLCKLEMQVKTKNLKNLKEKHLMKFGSQYFSQKC